ncbi:hypothetical protein CEXT_34391 [Caerostris extrusa]|uniref:Uncharacterized protein n=1 Tax=Caerostris extrusa TaxID=172846 RepID=A0AAV4PKB5_CAEEX|nr:hypothetical protein CEXT_34391 [Caerostris extrusa]
MNSDVMRIMTNKGYTSNLRRARQPLSSTQKTALPEGTPLGGRLRSPSRLSTLKPIKSFWTAPGGQVRPPLLTPLTVWSVCWSSPGDWYKRKRMSCVEGGKSGSTRPQLRTWRAP